MSGVELDKYRYITLKFINTNKSDLYMIYMQHLQQDGEGVLDINLENYEAENKVDVVYIPMTSLEKNLLDEIEKRKENNNDSSILYFLMTTPLEEKILEIEITALLG
jgi:hypothetical protein